MNLYLVRHGQTDWNIQQLIQGLTDIELNSTGIEQSKNVAESLKNINFTAIYSSPLKRTVETAQNINKYHNLSIITDKRIIERCFGDFEGIRNLSNNNILKDYWDYNLNLDSNNVESISALFNRVYNFLYELYSTYKDTNSNILIVTHGGVTIAITAIINNIKTDLFSLCTNNCEFRVFENVKLDKEEI